MICIICLIEKSIDKFYLRNPKDKDSYRKECKNCFIGKRKNYNQNYSKKYREIPGSKKKQKERDKLRKEYFQKWRLENKDKRSEYNKKYDKDHIYQKRNLKLKNNFGITIEEYNKMLENQNYSCGICEKEQTDFNKRLEVDHCHKTGKVRGLLCGKCNRGIGMFGDNEDLMLNAIKYIKNKGVISVSS